MRVGSQNGLIVALATHTLHSHSLPRVKYIAVQILLEIEMFKFIKVFNNLSLETCLY